MPTRKTNKVTGETQKKRRILGRVAPEDFVGRGAELRLVGDLAAHTSGPRNLLVLAAPMAGVSELLRQSFDTLFQERGGASPVYFSFSRRDQGAGGAALRFLQSFVVQTVAHRRGDPDLIFSPPTLGGLLDLITPSDYDWVERIVSASERARGEQDEAALIRLCLGAPQQAAAHGARTLVMIDDVHLAAELDAEGGLGAELAQMAAQTDTPFVLAGLRRSFSDVMHLAEEAHRAADTGLIHLERLSDEDARALATVVAARLGVNLSDETRDLMVQQFEGSPQLITALIRTAQGAASDLGTFRDFQRLYVDDLLGGRINRRFNAALEEIAPSIDTRRALVRVLYETAENVEGKSPVEAWRRRLGVEGAELKKVLTGLHVRELAGFDASYVETSRSLVWHDYLRASYRLHVAVEPRALVVANTLVDALKRAPQTMARYYRREAALGLRELLERFNLQRVPASLLHNDRFQRTYRGATPEEVAAGLEAETDLVRLPQVVHAASCASFHPPVQLVIDEERCAVAHGFDSSPYSEHNEVVWIAAEIDSKLEAGRALAEVWLDRLTQVVHACGFRRARLWLVAPEGFSEDANKLLNVREAFGSSRAQLELLAARLDTGGAGAHVSEAASNEFEMIMPMGDDTELIAAHTVEQIARRLEFDPEAISQIKHALVEACINASEHSLSPDRKIYQRFRLESDKLVVTVSSRGVAPPPDATISGGYALAHTNGREANDSIPGRRGWGLKLIRTLMDEVEFERVDDGTRLRMTKYLRK
ncbi:MAG TPA: ATP-binding protein [Pyrinomonadaceae bacterium]